MDEADDEYHGPPLPGGHRHLQGNSQMRQQMPYSSFTSAGATQRQPQTLQMAISREQEMFLMRQLELQRDIQLRRALIQEQHQQFISELESQQQLQQLQQQSPFTNPLLQQQRLLEMQQLGPSGGHRPFSLQDEQLLMQQQQQRIMRQQQMQTQERMLPRDVQIPDPKIPGTAGRSGPGLNYERARQILDEDMPRGNGEISQTSSDISRKQSKDKPGKDKITKEKAPKDKLVKSRILTEKTMKDKEKEHREEQTKSAESRKKEGKKESEGSGKTSAGQNEIQEKRKRTEFESEPLLQQPEKRLKEEDKANYTQTVPKLPAKKQQSDIALLLRATEDPSVKNRTITDFAVSSAESGLENQHSITSNGHKSYTEGAYKGISDSPKTSDLEALALEALRQNSRKPSNIRNDGSSHPDGQIAALIENLQRSTPPPLPIPLNEEKEAYNQSCEEESKYPDFMYFLPHLPPEPEYIEMNASRSSNKKAEQEEEDAEVDLANGKDADSGILGEARSGNTKSNVKLPGIEERAVKEPVVLPNPDESVDSPAVYTIPIDTWWPSNSVVRRERRLQGYRSNEEDSDKDEHGSTLMSETAMSALKERLENQMEPGVLQKIPHCKLHRLRTKARRDQCPVPLFCFQVTESHCTDLMVCCSICNTWRHVTCGGHYTKCPVQSNSGVPFKPICDRCFEESKIMPDYLKAQKRIQRQRIEHLRRTLSTTAVIRQASLAKHGGTYKWPLGSVTNTHIGGHTRSVHSRHERAEKQWCETATKLGNGLGYRPKERAKVRTREFERILVNVEDAEGHMDRHNMMLFLQNDTAKEHPAGFEAFCRNFFDHEEDPDLDTEEISDGLDSPKESAQDKSELYRSAGEERSPSGLESSGEEGSESESDGMSLDSQNIPQPGLAPDIEDLVKKKACSKIIDGVRKNRGEGSSPESSDTGENDTSSVVTIDSQGDENEEHAENANQSKDDKTKWFCARPGCKKKPRFDSLFCSDSCGVSAIERDILFSFDYATEIHPSLLRP